MNGPEGQGGLLPVKRLLAVCLAVMMLISAPVCAWAEETIAASLDTVTPDSIARYIARTACGRDVAALECLNETVDEATLDYYLGEIYGVDADALAA